jgi:hypothetical protein
MRYEQRFRCYLDIGPFRASGCYVTKHSLSITFNCSFPHLYLWTQSIPFLQPPRPSPYRSKDETRCPCGARKPSFSVTGLLSENLCFPAVYVSWIFVSDKEGSENRVRVVEKETNSSFINICTSWVDLYKHLELRWFTKYCILNIGFEVITAVLMKRVIVSVVTSCSWVKFTDFSEDSASSMFRFE